MVDPDGRAACPMLRRTGSNTIKSVLRAPRRPRMVDVIWTQMPFCPVSCSSHGTTPIGQKPGTTPRPTTTAWRDDLGGRPGCQVRRHRRAGGGCCVLAPMLGFSFWRDRTRSQ